MIVSPHDESLIIAVSGDNRIVHAASPENSASFICAHDASESVVVSSVASSSHPRCVYVADTAGVRLYDLRASKRSDHFSLFDFSVNPGDDVGELAHFQVRRLRTVLYWQTILAVLVGRRP